MNLPENRPEPSAEKKAISVWVDADACPFPVKEVLFRTAKRRKLLTTLVANQSIAIPKSDFIDRITVSDGADVADGKIVQLMQAGDLVITDDIPLAARVVEKGGVAIGMRGQTYDDASVHSRLASRNLMDQMRSAGIQTSGPKPYSNKDLQQFSNTLDRLLTKLSKRR